MKTHWVKRPRRARAKTPGQRVWGLAKLLYVRVVRINASPHQVATGVAVGVWLGVVPTFGLAGPVALLLAWLLRFNKAGALAGAMVMNPLTSPLFWGASAMAGAALTGADWHAIYGQVKNERYVFALSRTTYVYLAGNLVLATVVAALAYGLAYAAVKRRQTRRTARRAAGAGEV